MVYWVAGLRLRLRCLASSGLHVQGIACSVCWVINRHVLGDTEESNEKSQNRWSSEWYLNQANLDSYSLDCDTDRVLWTLFLCQLSSVCFTSRVFLLRKSEDEETGTFWQIDYLNHFKNSGIYGNRLFARY